MSRIRPENDLYRILMNVQKPGRYVGGEFGEIPPDTSAVLRIAICFPDLYEIGMSNQAIRILYSLFNGIPGVSCERVFAPAPDFESELKSRSLPLYSLESGTPINEFDILAFSIGYELSATNILTILETSGVALHNSDRAESEPIVIAGGPACTNPMPLGPFIDCIFIGEVEATFPLLLQQLVQQKKKGAVRQELLQLCKENRAVWSQDKKSPAFRDFWRDFGQAPAASLYPVPGVRTVQDHGVVEIMRGCPNGCRFCHAGYFYRPFREKDAAVIYREAELLNTKCGYREITISSLSTGDYSNIAETVQFLNGQFSERHVSFALPSLRVDSFTLPLIAEISQVRKSGLTFAVETPEEMRQMGLNKTVSREKTVDILKQAKRNGWNLAKFYFMIGLPFEENADETDKIADFIVDVHKRSGVRINVNVSTFIPKPHTPFQWASQLTEQQGLAKLQNLKSQLVKNRITMHYNSPFASYLEGIISRGDDRVADLILAAYRGGARLDAWEEHFDRELWRKIINDAPWDVESSTCTGRSVDETLPWDTVHLGVTKAFLAKEWAKSQKGELTEACQHECDYPCGICNTKTKVRKAAAKLPLLEIEKPEGVTSWLVLLQFVKEGKAAFLSHLDTMRVFERSITRAGCNMKYTEGFNPKPRLEFAHPLSLGIESVCEFARVELLGSLNKKNLMERLNLSLHDGFRIVDLQIIEKNPEKRAPSLMSRYWGSSYSIETLNDISAEHLLGRITPYYLEHGVEFEAQIVEKFKIQIQIVQSGKAANVVKMLAAVLQVNNPLPLVRIVRLNTYAADDTGKRTNYRD